MIDDVAEEMMCPDYDNNWETCVYVRVCCLVKILYGHLMSDMPNQCLIDESFAVCVLERVARPHPDGIYEWRQTAWEKLGGSATSTHDMKVEWKRCMDCVAGFFFSISGKGARRTWGSISPLLREAVSDARENGRNVMDQWALLKRSAVEEKESAYGPAWSMSFSKNADWATVSGLAACRMSVSAEQHLFSRAATSMLHFKRTYERAKRETPRLCFLDCVLMFGKGGYLVDDDSVRSPRSCHSYQIFDFNLVGGDESEEDANAVNDRLLKFLSATWHGNLGAHQAEMMALTLAFAGRDVGRFFILPDKSDSGKTTHDLAFCYFLGSEESSGSGSMSGTLHADWLCDENKLGFEGHRILHCKFTFTPEMSAKPLLNDIYKRLPTNVTQKLRKPHIDQVFDGSYGGCLHFLETNLAPKFVQ